MADAEERATDGARKARARRPQAIHFGRAHARTHARVSVVAVNCTINNATEGQPLSVEALVSFDVGFGGVLATMNYT